MKTNELLRSLALHKGMQIIAVLNEDDGEQPVDIQNCETREFASYSGKIFLDRSDFKKRVFETKQRLDCGIPDAKGRSNT